MTSWYLGLSTSGHDPALALVSPSGQVVFAEATERFLQDKRAWGVAPDHASHLQSALAQTDFDPERDQLVVATSWASRKSLAHRSVHDALLPATDTLWMVGLQLHLQESAGASLLRLGLTDAMPQVHRFEHHLCHAVSAAYFTPVQNATCLVIDGEGDVGATSLYRLRNRSISRVWRSWGPGSLGTFYGWLTGLCGFDWRLGEEWKVMGLAAFGKPIPDLVSQMQRMVIVDRGRLRFAGDEVIADTRRNAEQYGRASGDPVANAADLAASGQSAYAALADRILDDISADGEDNLVLSGGCALNSSYNGTIAGRAGFKRVFVPPSPADDGNAIGAALLAWMKTTGAAEIPWGGGSPFLGSRPQTKAIEKCRYAAGQTCLVTDLSGRSASEVATRLADGKILAVMRGPAEFGPRALGNRSILADPRPKDMKDRINAQVKGREAYRPFAPVVAEADLETWFSRSMASPYMSMTLPWRSNMQDRVPAVVHADGTGRVQTVTGEMYPWLDSLVTEFGRRTGVPVVLNTSFNIMGKPIVHSVEDAVAVLMTSGLDGILIEDLLVEKTYA